jgi:hypothetical protein
VKPALIVQSMGSWIVDQCISALGVMFDPPNDLHVDVCWAMTTPNTFINSYAVFLSGIDRWADAELLFAEAHGVAEDHPHVE